MNRVTSVTDADGKSVSSAYDLAGNITEYTDAKSLVTQYEYDERNQLEKTTYPDNSFITFNYDGNGNIKETHNSGSYSAFNLFTYDKLNRPISIRDQNGYTVGYSYDVAGNRDRITYPGNINVTIRI